MVLPLLVALTAVTTAEPIKLAAPQLQSVGVDPARGAFLSNYFAQQIATQGIRVTTSDEIAALLGLEQQKQLMNCADSSSSCVAELAGALGVNGVITGSVARTEKGSYVVAVKIISARDGSPLSLASGRFKDEDEVVDFFTAQAPRMAAEVTRAVRPAESVANVVKTPNPPPSTEVSAAPGRPMSTAWVPLAVGGALLAGGATSYVLARSDASRISSGGGITTEGGLSDAVRSGQNKESLGVFLGGAGLGALGAGALTYGNAPRSRGYLAAGTGAGLVVAGGVLLLLASSDAAKLRDGTANVADGQALSDAVRAGRGKEVVGEGLLGAGLSAAIVGALHLVRAQDSGTAGVAISPRGATFTVSGSFP
ncbi:MAG: hypothetical protein ACJ790_07095 [Myxococcaceae bacterium]